MTASALVVGNGESRAGIDLTPYLQQYITFGCNAISRDYKVNHLVCCDKRMVLESIPRSMPNIYTRQDWYPSFKMECVKQLPELPYTGSNRADDPFHWGSGPYAVLLATDFADDIHMIGFDLYGSAGTVNNIYKGTPNYKQEGTSSVDPSYWIYQISKVFESFPDKYFTVYNNDWEIPESWKMNNISFKTLDKLPLTV